MSTKFSVHQSGGAPLKLWDSHAPFEAQAMQQLRNIASLPFIHSHVAGMPDVHLGRGATVGSVIATKKAIIPAAVGVDIGCGMAAVRTTLRAHQLPDDLAPIRASLERAIPVGNGRGNTMRSGTARPPERPPQSRGRRCSDPPAPARTPGGNRGCGQRPGNPVGEPAAHLQAPGVGHGARRARLGDANELDVAFVQVAVDGEVADAPRLEGGLQGDAVEGVGFGSVLLLRRLDQALRVEVVRELEATGPLFRGRLGKTSYILTLSNYQRGFDIPYARNRNEEYYGAVKHTFADNSSLTLQAEYFHQTRHAPNSSAPMITDNKGTASNLDDEVIGYAKNLTGFNAFGPNLEFDGFGLYLWALAGTAPRWLDLEGYHTRFGDVRELLTGVDDRYVIMNAGDEMAFRFPALAPEHLTLVTGWDYLRVGLKHMD